MAESRVDAATDEAICHLQRRAFPATEEFRHGRYWIHRPGPDDLYVLAWQDDRLVGQTVLYQATAPQGRLACLGNVCSDPDVRRGGYASACVRRALDEAGRLGVDWTLLFCAPATVEFYRRLGFETVGNEVRFTRPDGSTRPHPPGDAAMVAAVSGRPWPDGPVVLDIDVF
ncbi:MAG: GNAT family N-acetyltransferase [Planctomycetes bacterium]|nr:GNAT family N-acetyltransferase [Planctomycetota bacterium]